MMTRNRKRAAPPRKEPGKRAKRSGDEAEFVATNTPEIDDSEAQDKENAAGMVLRSRSRSKPRKMWADYEHQESDEDEYGNETSGTAGKRMKRKPSKVNLLSTGNAEAAPSRGPRATKPNSQALPRQQNNKRTREDDDPADEPAVKILRLSRQNSGKEAVEPELDDEAAAASLMGLADIFLSAASKAAEIKPESREPAQDTRRAVQPGPSAAGMAHKSHGVPPVNPPPHPLSHPGYPQTVQTLSHMAAHAAAQNAHHPANVKSEILKEEEHSDALLSDPPRFPAFDLGQAAVHPTVNPTLPNSKQRTYKRGATHVATAYYIFYHQRYLALQNMAKPENYARQLAYNVNMDPTYEAKLLVGKVEKVKQQSGANPGPTGSSNGGNIANHASSYVVKYPAEQQPYGVQYQSPATTSTQHQQMASWPLAGRMPSIQSGQGELPSGTPGVLSPFPRIDGRTQQPLPPPAHLVGPYGYAMRPDTYNLGTPSHPSLSHYETLAPLKDAPMKSGVGSGNAGGGNGGASGPGMPHSHVSSLNTLLSNPPSDKVGRNPPPPRSPALSSPQMNVTSPPSTVSMQSTGTAPTKARLEALLDRTDSGMERKISGLFPKIINVSSEEVTFDTVRVNPSLTTNSNFPIKHLTNPCSDSRDEGQFKQQFSIEFPEFKDHRVATDVKSHDKPDALESTREASKVGNSSDGRDNDSRNSAPTPGRHLEGGEKTSPFRADFPTPIQLSESELGQKEATLPRPPESLRDTDGSSSGNSDTPGKTKQEPQKHFSGFIDHLVLKHAFPDYYEKHKGGLDSKKESNTNTGFLPSKPEPNIESRGEGEIVNQSSNPQQLEVDKVAAEDCGQEQSQPPSSTNNSNVQSCTDSVPDIPQTDTPDGGSRKIYSTNNTNNSTDNPDSVAGKEDSGVSFRWMDQPPRSNSPDDSRFQRTEQREEKQQAANQQSGGGTDEQQFQPKSQDPDGSEIVNGSVSPTWNSEKNGMAVNAEDGNSNIPVREGGEADSGDEEGALPVSSDRQTTNRLT